MKFSRMRIFFSFLYIHRIEEHTKNLKMIKFLLSIIVMCSLVDRCYCGSLPTIQQTEQTLVASLLNSNYNKNIRPDDPVSVDITATIQQILSIDEKQQIMTSSSFIS